MEAADQKSWRLYQFDFMGLRNTTDIIKTTAGRIRLLDCFFLKLNILKRVAGTLIGQVLIFSVRRQIDTHFVEVVAEINGVVTSTVHCC